MAFNKEKVMDAARKFVDKGQIDKAVKEYLRIVHEDPKDVRVWLKIGDLYAKKGSKQDAIETYLKVARFYHDQGFFLKAVAVYKQILKIDPRLVDVILKLAELYRQLGLMSDAMQHFENVAAHFHREGNTKEALATVKKLVDLDPENIATRIKLAELYSKEGLVEEASTEFTVACEQLRRQNRQDDFLKVAERLLWHKPENHALNRELAGLYLRRNDPRRALQKLQACFKSDPRDVETLGLLAQAFQALDQKAKTVSVLKELARVHIENKARDKATEVFRKILEFVPNDPDALQFLGMSAAPPPAPAPPPPRPAPPVRASTPIPQTPTPIPAQVRAHTNDAKFNITGEIPAMQQQRMTGSMPLVDEQSLSGVDFALPEYDDADFSADMEPPPDPRKVSAAGERHAEEISKILAETDVYVKYGLHQKAIDHLRRVFTLDTENVEAHERLKDIFVSQGREQEAEVELLKLAEAVASNDPDRAEAYLQELLAMNGTHTGAFELARRFRLRVARMSSVSSEVEYGGGLAAVDGDLEELELASPPPRQMATVRSPAPMKRDSVDDFDPVELIAPRAHGSPAPGRPPGPPRAGVQHAQPETDAFELDFDSNPASQSTRQMSPDHAAALANMPDDDLDLGDEVVRPQWGALDDAVEAQLDDESLGQDIDHEVAVELAGDDDLPFDAAAARAFDHGIKPQTEQNYVSGFEETDLPRRNDGFDDMADDGLSVAGGYDPYSGSVQTPPYDATAHGVGDTTGPEELVPVDVIEPSHQRAESTVEDDLDEADFYAGQGMYTEAMDVLRNLLAHYPNHRLIRAKLQEIETIMTGGVASDDSVDVGTEDAVAEPHGTDAIDLHELEEVGGDDLVDLEPDAPKKQRQPSVMLEKPLEESDAETHYDLGLAYKEMGLFDEAIKAFEKTLRAPGRAVQCHVMIGMCHREMGNASEAVQQFKQGLHAAPNDRERLSLHYEIANTYEAIGDEAEALYYFETVLKRDPNFADAVQRAAYLRSRVGRGVRPADADDSI